MFGHDNQDDSDNNPQITLPPAAELTRPDDNINGEVLGGDAPAVAPSDDSGSSTPATSRQRLLHRFRCGNFIWPGPKPYAYQYD